MCVCHQTVALWYGQPATVKTLAMRCVSDHAGWLIELLALGLAQAFRHGARHACELRLVLLSLPGVLCLTMMTMPQSSGR